MQGYKTHTLERPVIVTVDRLSNLVDKLQAQAEKKLEFEIECSNGTRLYPEGLEDLAGYPNPASAKITSLSIHMSYSEKNRVELTLRNGDLDSGSFTIRGEEGYISSTSKMLQDHIEGMVGDRPYFVSGSAFVRYGLGVLLYFIFLCIAWFGIIGLFSKLKLLSSAGYVACSFCGLVGLALSSAIPRAIPYFFPSAVFCIGAGVARFESMRSLRSKIGIGALCSLTVGLIGRVIWFVVTER